MDISLRTGEFGQVSDKTSVLLSDDQPVTEVDDFRDLIAEGQERGFLTFERIATCLEEAEVTKEQVQGLHAYFEEHGIDVVENDGRLARSEVSSVEASAPAPVDEADSERVPARRGASSAALPLI